jgi:Flp pilus assembly pilin Flp
MIRRIVGRLLGDEDDATIVECRVVAALVSVAAISALSATGGSLAGTIGALQAELLKAVGG